MDLAQLESGLTVSGQIGPEEIEWLTGNDVRRIVNARLDGETPNQLLAAGRRCAGLPLRASTLKSGSTWLDDQREESLDLTDAFSHLVAVVSTAAAQTHAGPVWTTHVGLAGEEP